MLSQRCSEEILQLEKEMKRFISILKEDQSTLFGFYQDNFNSSDVFIRGKAMISYREADRLRNLITKSENLINFTLSFECNHLEDSAQLGDVDVDVQDSYSTGSQEETKWTSSDEESCAEENFVFN